MRKDVTLINDDAAPVHPPEAHVARLCRVGEARDRHEDDVERGQLVRRAELVLGRAKDEDPQRLGPDVLLDLAGPLADELRRDDDESGRRDDDLDGLAVVPPTGLALRRAGKETVEGRRLLEKVEERLRERVLAVDLVKVRVAARERRRLDLVHHERAQ